MELKRKIQKKNLGVDQCANTFRGKYHVSGNGLILSNKHHHREITNTNGTLTLRLRCYSTTIFRLIKLITAIFFSSTKVLTLRTICWMDRILKKSPKCDFF